MKPERQAQPPRTGERKRLVINCRSHVRNPRSEADRGWLQRLVRSHFSQSNTSDRDVEVYRRLRMEGFRKTLKAHDMHLRVMYRRDGIQVGIRVELRTSEKLKVTLML